MKGVFLEWSGGGFRLFGGVWTEAVRLRPCFPGGLVFSTKSRIPGWLLELRGSTRLTAFLLVGIGVHLALGLTAIALGQPCLSYRTWRGAKTSQDNRAKTGTRLGWVSVTVFSILLIIGICRSGKTQETFNYFADYSNGSIVCRFLASYVGRSGQRGCWHRCRFSPSETVNLDPKEVTALQFDDSNEEEFFLTDAGLVHLKRYPNRKHLNLDGAIRTTDNGLKQLARVPRLTYLNIDDTVITDEGLKYVGRLGELEVLVIGVARLQAVLEDCIIFHAGPARE